MVLLLVLLLCGIAQAAPVITNVSGTVSNGSEITITGSGFEIKSPAQPWIWADFETSINPTTLGTLTSWVSTQNANRATGSACWSGYGCLESTPASSAGSWSFEVQFNDDRTPIGFDVKPNKTYVYRKIRLSGPNWTNHKTLRAYNGNPGTSANFYPVYGQAAGGAEIVFHNEWCVTQCRRTTGNTGDTPLGPPNDGSPWIQETLIEGSDINVHNGNLIMYHSNTTKVWRVENECMNCGASSSGIYSMFIRIGMEDQSSPRPTGQRQYMDDIYVDKTWQRAQVCEGSTFSTKGACEMLIPRAWSDTSITAKVLKGQMSTGTKYIYVSDTSNNVNFNGYPVILSGDSGRADSAPSPPQTVNVH